MKDIIYITHNSNGLQKEINWLSGDHMHIELFMIWLEEHMIFLGEEIEVSLCSKILFSSNVYP